MNQQVVDEQFVTIKDFLNKAMENLDEDEALLLIEKVEEFLGEKAEEFNDQPSFEDTEGPEDDI